MPLRLLPGEEDQSREASISEIDELIASSTNPSFVKSAEDFRDRFHDGDTLIERCTAKKAWDTLTGWAGFELVRNGESVAALTCKMN